MAYGLAADACRPLDVDRAQPLGPEVAPDGVAGFDRALGCCLAVLRGARTSITGGAFATLARYVRYGDTDWANQIAAAMHGIDHAANTGRLAGSIVIEIRGLSDYRMCSLVAEVASNCEVAGEVPRFLISRFAGN